jgi:hypothetical protein
MMTTTVTKLMILLTQGWWLLASIILFLVLVVLVDGAENTAEVAAGRNNMQAVIVTCFLVSGGALYYYYLSNKDTTMDTEQPPSEFERRMNRIPQEPNVDKYPETPGIILPEALDFGKLKAELADKDCMTKAIRLHTEKCIKLGLEITDLENEPHQYTLNISKM